MEPEVISHKDEPYIMFENRFLERLSKIHWSAPLIIFTPVAMFLLYMGHALPGISIGLNFIGGLLLWTFSEYVIHRFVFHAHIGNDRIRKIHYTIHGAHHSYPNDSTRLVIPPVISIPVSIGFYYLFGLVIPKPYLYVIFSGFIIGYAIYDTLHYVLHHYSFTNPWMVRLKRNHMRHHFRASYAYFGVSQLFWDKVFRTNKVVDNSNP